MDLPVSISFGKAELTVKDVLKLTTGSIVELNRGVNDPVEVLVNQLPDRARRSGGGGGQLRRANPGIASRAGTTAELPMTCLPFASPGRLDALAAVAASTVCALPRCTSWFTLTERRAQAGVEEPKPPYEPSALRSTGSPKKSRKSGSSRSWSGVRDSKPGLNLSKRSQALRMHRRGDSCPSQVIADVSCRVRIRRSTLLLKVATDP